MSLPHVARRSLSVSSRRVLCTADRSCNVTCLDQRLPVPLAASSSTSILLSLIRDKLAPIVTCRPFLMQLAASTVKTTAADILIQTVAEKKSFEEIDWRRTSIFTGFGFVYLGGFQWWLLINKYKQWFPSMKRFSALPFKEKLRCKEGLIDGMKMVLFDITVHSPMIYFPTYYSLKEFVGGHKWNPADWIKDGLAKYSANASEDLTAMVLVTVPSDCIQVMMPLQTRMLFRHFVSFFWTAYVSFSRGALEDDEEEDGKAPTCSSGLHPGGILTGQTVVNT
mmetsp:Transcript_1727/g.3804  ORF Transcript_1727/g.3804 Transcript_1727/m.3804 type:complete len:280 (-) Transcript_1727:2986-3825(-)